MISGSRVSIAPKTVGCAIRVATGYAQPQRHVLLALEIADRAVAMDPVAQRSHVRIVRKTVVLARLAYWIRGVHRARRVCLALKIAALARVHKDIVVTGYANSAPEKASGQSTPRIVSGTVAPIRQGPTAAMANATDSRHQSNVLGTAS